MSLIVEDKFGRLAKPHIASDGVVETFAAVELGDGGVFRIAKDARSQPALLIKPPSTGSVTSHADMQLQNVEVRFGVSCRTSVDDDIVKQEDLTVVRCLSDSLQVQAMFFRLVGALVSQFEAQLKEGSIDKVIQGLVALLHAAALPARASVLGLWGELVVIHRSEDPKSAINAWHGDPHERFDFATPQARCEVKTTAQTQRLHKVKYDQIAAAGRPTLIASLQTTLQDGGVGVGDLIDLIQSRVGVDSDEGIRLLTVSAETLGADADLATTARFDLEMGCESLRFLLAEDIPRPPEPIPTEVSELTFTVDVSGVECGDHERMTELLDAVGLG